MGQLLKQLLRQQMKLYDQNSWQYLCSTISSVSGVMQDYHGLHTGVFSNPLLYTLLLLL